MDTLLLIAKADKAAGRRETIISDIALLTAANLQNIFSEEVRTPVNVHYRLRFGVSMQN